MCRCRAPPGRWWSCSPRSLPPTAWAPSRWSVCWPASWCSSPARRASAGRCRFIPWPVIEGFTLGIAVIIFLQQIPALTGAQADGILHTNVIATAPSSLASADPVYLAWSLVRGRRRGDVHVPAAASASGDPGLAGRHRDRHPARAGAALAARSHRRAAVEPAHSGPPVLLARRRSRSCSCPPSPWPPWLRSSRCCRPRVAASLADTGPYDPDRELVGQGLASIGAGAVRRDAGDRRDRPHRRERPRRRADTRSPRSSTRSCCSWWCSSPPARSARSRSRRCRACSWSPRSAWFILRPRDRSCGPRRADAIAYVVTAVVHRIGGPDRRCRHRHGSGRHLRDTRPISSDRSTSRGDRGTIRGGRRAHRGHPPGRSAVLRRCRSSARDGHLDSTV